MELYEDLENYVGWAMELSPRASIEHCLFELKTWFSIDGYSFSENTYRMAIFDGHTRQEIEVILPEQQHGSYKVTLRSVPLVFRARDERAHQALFLRIYHKISGMRKKGFWLRKDGTRIPIHIPKRLRQKRRKKR